MAAHREIGGYFELERYCGSHYHETALHLNCGRGCISYLVEAHHIKSVWIPHYICSSVIDRFNYLDVKINLYYIDSSFQPRWDTINASDDDYLYLVDFYGQLSDQSIDRAQLLFDNRIIVDESQGFFRTGRENVDTLYTTRKYFGVADGAYLYTNERIERDLEQDESHNRMHYLLGRLERTATEFFEESRRNNRIFDDEPAKQMSAITESLLSAVDYNFVRNRRERNFAFLEQLLAASNKLSPVSSPGPFCYPLLVENGPAARKALAAQKIYIPTYWPNVLADVDIHSLEYHYANNILPLPVDQRYGIDEMRIVVNTILELGVI